MTADKLAPASARNKTLKALDPSSWAAWKRHGHAAAPLAGLLSATMHLHSIGLFVPWAAMTSDLGRQLHRAECWLREKWPWGALHVAHHVTVPRLRLLQRLLDEHHRLTLSRADIATDMAFARDQHLAGRFLHRRLFVRRGATKHVRRLAFWDDNALGPNGNFSSCDFTEDSPRSRKPARLFVLYADSTDSDGILLGQNVLRLELRIARAARAWPFAGMRLDEITERVDPVAVLARHFELRFSDPKKIAALHRALVAAQQRAVIRGKARHVFKPVAGAVIDRRIGHSEYVARYTRGVPFSLPITPIWS